MSDTENNVTPFTPGRRFPVPANAPAQTGGDDFVNDTTEFEIAWEMPGGQVEVQYFEGAIVATSVFVGIADPKGFLQFIVPLSRLLFVRPVEEIILNSVA